MRRVLSNAIIFYWAAFFAVLSAICALQPDHGLVEAYRLLGLAHITSAVADAGGIWLTGGFGAAFGILSLVFLWALVANVLDDGASEEVDDILRLAFACSALALAVLMAAAAALSASGVMSSLTVLLGALAASYVASHMERGTAAERSASERKPSSARTMAAIAARHYALRRFGGNAHQRGRR